MKMYIAVLEDVPDHMTPTIVGHSVLGAHLRFHGMQDKDGVLDQYDKWLETSYKKCVVRVNRKEFDKIANLPYTYLGHENKTLDGIKVCAIPVPCEDSDLPNVLKFAKLWKPIGVIQ